MKCNKTCFIKLAGSLVKLASAQNFTKRTESCYSVTTPGKNIR